MFIDKNGNLYQGDMQVGDREATSEEIQAFNAKQELDKKIAEAKAYLVDTDYITAKYNDEVTVNSTISKADFVSKYSSIYAKMEEARTFLSEVL